MKKKIVFLADCLVTQKAGIHYYAKQFIKRAIKSYPDNDYYMVVPEKYEAIDIKQIVVPINSNIPLHLRIRNIWHIPNTLKKLGPDVVIEMAHFGPFRLDNKVQRVTVMHDLTPILYPEWHDRASHYVHRLSLKRILRNASHIIANSHVTKKDITNYYSDVSDKIKVSYPSLDINLSKQSKSDDVYLLSVGTIEPRKNYSQLISAFEQTASQNADVQLVLVGFKGWKSAPIFEQIKKSKYSDRIIIKGYVTEEELIELYTHAQAFVFPTNYEGFGLPLLESMTIGTLIICSDITINHEVCQDGALYYGTTDELSALMQSVLQDASKHQDIIQIANLRAEKINNSPLELDEIFG